LLFVDKKDAESILDVEADKIAFRKLMNQI
jgi:hypothetical protein